MSFSNNQWRVNQFTPFLITAVVYLVSSLPGLNWLYLLFSLVGFLYWTLRKKDEIVLLLLLLGSSFSYTSVNIWNSGLIPVLPLLLLVLSMFIVGFRFKFNSLVIASMVIGGLLVISVKNVLSVGVSYVAVDLLVLASIPFAALRFRGMSENKFFLVIALCALIFLSKTVLFAFAGIDNPVLSAYNDEKFLDNFDELLPIYMLFALVLMLMENPLRMLVGSLFGILVFHYISSGYWLGYYGIGSQVVLMVILFFFFFLFRFHFMLFAIVFAFFIGIQVLGTDLGATDDLKLKQLISVFDGLAWLDIALLPHSVHVRMAEILTFIDSDWTWQIVGNGLGGYVNISDHFPRYLGLDDYSEQQIALGKVISPHNLGYLLIKFGYIGLALSIWFLFWIYHSTLRMAALKCSLYITFGLFLILNLGYTLKISFLLGILWVVIRDYNRQESEAALRSNVSLKNNSSINLRSPVQR